MAPLTDVRRNVLAIPLRFSVALSATILFLACQEATTPDGDSTLVALEIVSGDGQEGSVGQELPTPIVVRALDAKGRRMKNHLVNFDIQGTNARDKINNALIVIRF